MGNQLFIGFGCKGWVPLGVTSGPHYGDACITGVSATCVSDDRRKWRLFDLWHPERDRLDARFWHPTAELLGRGHLVRLVDSCCRIGIYPDPAQLGLSFSIEDGTRYWQAVIEKLIQLHELILAQNRDVILPGDFNRLHMRVLVTGAKAYIGPPHPGDWRPAGVQLIVEPLGAYARPISRIVPARRVTSGDLMARAKSSSNYSTYMALRQEAVELAAVVGVDADDFLSLKLIGPSGLVGPGEASTATLGGIWEIRGKDTVLVPDPDEANTLVGRTARWVMRLAEDQLRIPADYGLIDLGMLFCAKELWKTGNATWLSSISHIGCLALPSIKVGRVLDELLRAAMRGELYPEHSLLVKL